MRFNQRLCKRGHKSNAWDENDSPLMLDQYRALFGESNYLQGYMQMGTFKDLLNGTTTGTRSATLDDSIFSDLHPNLFLLLTATSDDEGKPRLPCTLTIVCEDGQAKCGLNERNHSLSLWTSCGELSGVFLALEEALEKRPVAWRRVSWKGKK